MNVTPCLVSFDMPVIGSFSAFPNVIEADFMSVPIATLMSRAALVAWSKMSFPLPTSFLIPVNVRRRFSPDAMASSSTPDFFINCSARVETWSAETFATPPVLLMTEFV